MDIMYIDDEAPALHVVDGATSFSPSKSLLYVTKVNVSSTFVKFWSSIYTGILNRIRVDRGSRFEDALFSVFKMLHISLVRSSI